MELHGGIFRISEIFLSLYVSGMAYEGSVLVLEW
jgi:hypothetical protein